MTVDIKQRWAAGLRASIQTAARVKLHMEDASRLRAELRTVMREVTVLESLLDEERRIRGRGGCGPYVALSWSDVEGFFRQRCVMSLEDGEMEWYREAWTALGNASLLGTSRYADPSQAEAVLKLRALCLAVMYLGLYEAANGTNIGFGAYFSGHVSLWSYLDELGVHVDTLIALAQSDGSFEDLGLEADEDGECSEDDELWAAAEFAEATMESDCRAIHQALEHHFGGDIGLFMAIWNSRLAPCRQESVEVAVNSFEWGDGKVEVWDYVKGGMAAWTMPPTERGLDF